MSKLDNEIEECSVGSMMPVVTPDQTLSKDTSFADVDKEFDALKIFSDNNDPREYDGESDETVGDTDRKSEGYFNEGALENAFSTIKNFVNVAKMRKENKEDKEYMEIFNKYISIFEKYMAETDKSFVKFSSLKRKVRKISKEDAEKIIKKKISSKYPIKDIYAITFSSMNSPVLYMISIKHENTYEIGYGIASKFEKLKMYYTDCCNIRYLKVPSANKSYWEKTISQITKKREPNINEKYESADILHDNGLDSVIYEDSKIEDRVVFESFFGKKKKSNFTIKPFEYSKDEYAKAIKKFYEDLIYGLDEFYAKDVIYSNGSIHINVNSDDLGPVPDELDDNINNPRLSKHKLYDFTWTYIFRYDKFTFIFSIDPEMFTIVIELLYVEGATDYYTLDEFLHFVGRNKRAFDFWDPGKVKCSANCISTKKHVKIDGIFEKTTEVSKSKGVTTIKFIDEDFNESFDEETFNESVVDDIAAKVRMSKERKWLSKDNAEYKKENKEFCEIMSKIDKLLANADKLFIPYSALKREVSAIPPEQIDSVCKELGVSKDDVKLVMMKLLNKDEVVATWIVSKDNNDAHHNQIVATPESKYKKYWAYYNDCVDVKYFHMPSRGLDFWRKALSKLENNQKVNLESADDILHDNGLDSVIYEDSKIEDRVDYFDDEFFGEAAKIDDDIKDIIDTLNKKGYKTLYSCSGHPSARLKSDGKRDGIKDKKLYSTAKIVFAENYDFESYPEGWVEKLLDNGNVGIYVKGPTFKIINGLPTKQFYAWKQKYMRNLKNWADELPNKGEESDDSEEVTESMNEMLQDLMIDLS